MAKPESGDWRRVVTYIFVVIVKAWHTKYFGRDCMISKTPYDVYEE